MIATAPAAKPGIYFTQAFDAQKLMPKNSLRAIGFPGKPKS
ncbi:hypothetical protein [Tychonema sp. LEGE 07203]|nr:hypothetical protein [Tychonema sp. LEGE 07203]